MFLVDQVSGLVENINIGIYSDTSERILKGGTHKASCRGWLVNVGHMCIRIFYIYIILYGGTCTH